MNPNHVPDEFKVPYDIIDLPSQGILYPNKKSSVKVEYITASDENILSSPNIIANNNGLDILLKRKVKDLGFDLDQLLEGDRIAILLYLRSTAFGPDYTQLVLNEKREIVEGIIDLSQLKYKNLTINPDEKGEFDFELPYSKKKVKFRLLSGKDEKELKEIDEKIKPQNDGLSSIETLRLERSIMEVDGVRDKLKIAYSLKNNSIKLMDVRSLKKYVTEIEPGIDLKTKARIQGGDPVDCFLKIGGSFWFPEI
jgi:hypothetical protein